MLNYEQARKVFDDMSIGYRPVESRFNALSSNSSEYIDNKIIDSHILLDRINDINIPNVEFFDNVNVETKSLLKKFVDPIDNIVNNQSNYLYSFYLMSSSWNNASRILKHIHTLIQNNPLRCITWSFPIVVYRDPNETRKNKFFFNSRKDLYPKITYTSHDRMEKQDVEMLEVDISMQCQMSFYFNSSKMLHYVNHTNHLIIWKVFDGVTKTTKFPDTELIIDFHHA